MKWGTQLRTWLTVHAAYEYSVTRPPSSFS